MAAGRCFVDWVSLNLHSHHESLAIAKPKLLGASGFWVYMKALILQSGHIFFKRLCKNVPNTFQDHIARSDFLHISLYSSDLMLNTTTITTTLSRVFSIVSRIHSVTTDQSECVPASNISLNDLSGEHSTPSTSPIRIAVGPHPEISPVIGYDTSSQTSSNRHSDLPSISMKREGRQEVFLRRRRQDLLRRLRQQSECTSYIQRRYYTTPDGSCAASSSLLHPLEDWDVVGLASIAELGHATRLKRPPAPVRTSSSSCEDLQQFRNFVLCHWIPSMNWSLDNVQERKRESGLTIGYLY